MTAAVPENSPAARKRRPWLSSHFVQAMLAGHSALGLAFAALIFVVCFSGTLSVFLYDLQIWEQPKAPRAATLTPRAAQAAIVNGYKQAIADKSDHDLRLVAPGAITSRAMLRYHDHETGVSGTWIVDADGRLAARLAAPWTDFLQSLHIYLHLPRTWGMFLVGLTGVTLLSSLISGLLAHPRIFKDAFALRWGGSRRLQEADVHNRLGVWGLPFHVAVSLTGALLGLSSVIVGVLALAAYDGNRDKALQTLLGPRASEDQTAAPLPDVEAMIQSILREQPAAQLVMITVQHAAKAGQVVNLGMRSPGHLALANDYFFKGDGTPLGESGYVTGSVGRRILGMIQPLHFGWFGGLPIKIAYGVLGLALSIVTHTGVTIWLARRRDKGRPAAVWERIWPALAWSQPLGLACAATAGLLVGGSAIAPSFFGTCGFALACAAAGRDAYQVSRALRFLTALSLAALPIAHIYVWGGFVGGGVDATSTAVNAVMACTSVLLFASLSSPNSRPAA